MLKIKNVPLLLTVVMGFVYNIRAIRWTTSTYPSLTTEADECNSTTVGNSFVCDPERLLSTSQRRYIQEEAENLSVQYRSCDPIVGYRVAFLFARDIDDGSGSDTEEVRRFCRTMLSKWGLEQFSGCTNAMMVCISSKLEEVAIVGTNHVLAFEGEYDLKQASDRAEKGLDGESDVYEAAIKSIREVRLILNKEADEGSLTITDPLVVATGSILGAVCCFSTIALFIGWWMYKRKDGQGLLCCGGLAVCCLCQAGAADRS
mmetsp:Transcript_33200/g.37697  ORF Transcript_33200/g.37697 Transcript_33200/m.37697 type:complete len:260 (-) Transcript_33200:475-1254(-)